MPGIPPPGEFVIRNISIDAWSIWYTVSMNEIGSVYCKIENKTINETNYYEIVKYQGIKIDILEPYRDYWASFNDLDTMTDYFIYCYAQDDEDIPAPNILKLYSFNITTAKGTYVQKLDDDNDDTVDDRWMINDYR